MTRPSRRAAAAGAALAAAVAAAPSHADDVVVPAAAATWVIRLPAQSRVDYRGAVSFDGAGMGSGTMLYPAPGIAGLLVAIATHATIVNATRDSQKTKLQADADRVLTPYQAALSSFESPALFRRALEKMTTGASPALIDAKAPASGLYLVESAPVFVMTQDQRALLLDNSITVFSAAKPGAPLYQNLVRVVSDAEPEADVVERWSADDGRLLKERSAELLARSLDIAVAVLTAPPVDAAGNARTFRYIEGGGQRMERGELIRDSCRRVTLRTLRGWLMSVPVREQDGGAC